MHEFHSSNLDKGARFRESLRFRHGLSTEHLDRAQSILDAALQKTGHESLSAHNFDDVMEHMRRDPQYQRLHSAGPAFESALRAHLGVPEENQT